MPRRKRTPPRRTIFVGTEGDSERAFVKFLQRCCDEAGLHVHLYVSPGDGGDTVAIVQSAHRRLTRAPGGGEFSERIVLLDEDRRRQDIQRGRAAEPLARKHGFKVILQKPNLEGLLLRLYRGQEQRRVAPADALVELRKHWPRYRKPPMADELSDRFNLGSLRRAARHDQAIEELLRILGL